MPAFQTPEHQALRWHLAPDPARGVVTVFHGLNNRVSVMHGIAEALNRSGYHAVRVAYHQDGPGTPEKTWLQLAETAILSCRQRFPELPCCTVSYSLGALLALATHRLRDTVAYAAGVLLAPALTLTPAASLVRLATLVAFAGWAIPSGMPPELRFRPATPLSEYDALFRLIAQVDTPERLSKLADLPTLVLMQEDDELISYRGLGNWIAARKLREWHLEPVVGHANSPSRHLVIAERYLGLSAWQNLLSRTVAHLDRHCAERTRPPTDPARSRCATPESRDI